MKPSPLPAGTYRLSATRGLAYTVDEARVAVGRGEFVEADLELRRVLETPGWVACDLHVHARPSFDSLVSVEDRLRTLAAAGVRSLATTGRCTGRPTLTLCLRADQDDAELHRLELALRAAVSGRAA